MDKRVMLSAMDTKEAGRLGGIARAANLDKDRRIEIGKLAAQHRWRLKDKYVKNTKCLALRTSEK